jgi:hypothetical protein
MDIVTASPPVSPRVVATTLMIQNQSVTSGTFCTATSTREFIFFEVEQNPPGSELFVCE